MSDSNDTDDRDYDRGRDKRHRDRKDNRGNSKDRRGRDDDSSSSRSRSYSYSRSRTGSYHTDSSRSSSTDDDNYHHSKHSKRSKQKNNARSKPRGKDKERGRTKKSKADTRELMKYRSKSKGRPVPGLLNAHTIVDVSEAKLAEMELKINECKASVKNASSHLKGKMKDVKKKVKQAADGIVKFEADLKKATESIGKTDVLVSNHGVRRGALETQVKQADADLQQLKERVEDIEAEFGGQLARQRGKRGLYERYVSVCLCFFVLARVSFHVFGSIVLCLWIVCGCDF